MFVLQILRGKSIIFKSKRFCKHVTEYNERSPKKTRCPVEMLASGTWFMCNVPVLYYWTIGFQLLLVL